MTHSKKDFIKWRKEPGFINKGESLKTKSRQTLAETLPSVSENVNSKNARI